MSIKHYIMVWSLYLDTKTFNNIESNRWCMSFWRPK